MSRLAQPRAAQAVKRDARPSGGDSKDEICPVCKSSRYLNANIRFLINPDCYHKMCASCVDRIFGHGPAQCPISGCRRTLRRHNFRQQTFEDLKVEREVDIRKRVAAVFNRREEEFEDLRSYNDYLNEVEDITFNLIEGIDVEETKKRLDAYEKANEEQIRENKEWEARGVVGYKDLQKKEREQMRLRREAARREEEEEKREMEEARRDQMRRLAAGEDAESIERDQKVVLKRRLDRRAAEERQRRLQAQDAAAKGAVDSVTIRGLKQRKPTEPEAPIDPFGGLRLDHHNYYSLQSSYPYYSWLDGTRTETKILTGGYEVSDYTARALCDAFSGLGVFVADEVAERQRSGQDDGASSMGAGIAAKDVEMTA